MSSVLLPAFFTTCPVFFHLVPDDFDQLSGLHIWILRPKDKPKTWTFCWTNGYIIHIYIYMIDCMCIDIWLIYDDLRIIQYI
jgi:hypothetical protein